MITQQLVSGGPRAALQETPKLPKVKEGEIVETILDLLCPFTIRFETYRAMREMGREPYSFSDRQTQREILQTARDTSGAAILRTRSLFARLPDELRSSIVAKVKDWGQGGRCSLAPSLMEVERPIWRRIELEHADNVDRTLVKWKHLPVFVAIGITHASTEAAPVPEERVAATLTTYDRSPTAK